MIEKLCVGFMGVMILSLTACASKIENPVIRISTTTSVNDSGLMAYLQPVFEKDTGYKLEITSAGTGAAIEKARKGDADLLLVHAKASEEEFINEGFGEVRVPFMYNFFVIVGPEGDPAGVKGSATAAEAFKKIADSGSTFVSRGDDSGTHKAELKSGTWSLTHRSALVRQRGTDGQPDVGNEMRLRLPKSPLAHENTSVCCEETTI